MSEGKTNMFGKTYNTIGSTESNFIIKTKGDLKILWGNKYIDLIKNGKIASQNGSIFKNVDSEDAIQDDGIYLVGEQLWIAISGKKFNISLDENTEGAMFVSFIQDQDTTSELKHKALTNIGLYYQSINDVPNNYSGIVYIEDALRLYIANNGIIKPYIEDTILEEQKVINEFNELKIGPLHLYSQEGFGIIDSSIAMILSSLGIPYIILEDRIKILENLQIDDSKLILSKEATEEYGYRLYIENGLSTLEIDNLVQRKYPLYITYKLLLDMMERSKLSPKMYYLITDFQNPWELSWEEEGLYYQDEYQEIDGTQYLSGIRNAMQLIVQAASINTINIQAFDPLHPDWIIHYDPYYLEGFRKKIVGEEEIVLLSKGRITYLKDEYGNEANFNFRQLRFKRKLGTLTLWNYCMDTGNSLYGEFLAGNNNNFIIPNLDIYVLSFVCEPVVNSSSNIISYNTVVKDSNIQISKGHNLLINSISNNNIFEFKEVEETILHTINKDVILENNIFVNIKELQILEGATIQNNSINNIDSALIIGKSFENNNWNNVLLSNTIEYLSFISNNISETTLNIQGDSEGTIQGNNIYNSKLKITNKNIIIDNIINDCSELTVINDNILENNNISSSVYITNTGSIKNNIFSNILYLQNSTIMYDSTLRESSNIINEGDYFTNNTVNSSIRIENRGAMQDNIINSTDTIVNSGQIINNNIDYIGRLENNTSFLNNKLGNIIGIINTKNFNDNNINNIDKLFYNRGGFTNNTINNVTNTTIANTLIHNNIIIDISNCNIYNLFLNNNIKGSLIDTSFNNLVLNNNIEGDIKNSQIGNFENNIITGDIYNCSFSEFINNVVNANLSLFTTTGTVDSCVFNNSINQFTALIIYYCTFGKIDNFILNIPVYYTTFHGLIGNVTKPLTQYEASLLSDPSKKTEAFPNIKVISIPDIIITGMIMMWYSQNPIPTGWAICDGNNGTPDLRDRFIRGASSVSDVGEVNPDGVSADNTITLKKENLPEHSHPHEQHQHDISEFAGYTLNSGQLTMTGNRLSLSNTITAVLGVSSTNASISITKGTSGYYYTEKTTDYKGGDHFHQFTIPEHKTSFVTSMEKLIEWLNTPIKIEPRHFKLIFIMKIDEN